ncbi:unnamed protein product [Acanthocheilonema viteae]|uniref:ABC transmembrane type-1 domain-containing protein n=1 Tax=Acanthocheilonema viteae TaxID=6277 RepID=A0A498SHZ0_ACAVI|nr:unnamed protein product [Acanthocheilonema viteae]
MTQNGQHHGDLSNVDQKASMEENTPRMNNDKQHVNVADVNSKNEITVDDRFTMNSGRNVDLVEQGSEAFGMQCRNVAIIISSLIICFYHEMYLSLVVMSVIPLVITLNILSKKLSKKSDLILSGKISQTIQLEKELLLQKNSNDKIANDEHLMRLSTEVRSCTRYAILHQIWKSSHSGILSFTIFTFIGCGMLYGGYLLSINSMMKEGDIFIIVLSMGLIVDSISTTTTYYHRIKKAIHAALYIWNLQQFDYQFMVRIFLIVSKVDL